MLDEVLKARRQDQGDAMNQHRPERHLDREVCITLCPLCLLTSRLESWDEILV